MMIQKVKKKSKSFFIFFKSCGFRAKENNVAKSFDNVFSFSLIAEVTFAETKKGLTEKTKIILHFCCS